MDIHDRHLLFYLVMHFLSIFMTSQGRALPSHHSEPAGHLLDVLHNNPAESMETEGGPFHQEALQLTLTCYD